MPKLIPIRNWKLNCTIEIFRLLTRFRFSSQISDFYVYFIYLFILRKKEKKISHHLSEFYQARSSCLLQTRNAYQTRLFFLFPRSIFSDVKLKKKMLLLKSLSIIKKKKKRIIFNLFTVLVFFFFF